MILVNNNMKKGILSLMVIGMMSFAADKYITIKLSEQQLNFHWKNLENIKIMVDQSNLPHSQAKMIISSLDSLQKDIKKSARIDSVANNLTIKK